MTAAATTEPKPREGCVMCGRIVDYGKLRPVLDKIFPFDEAAQAHALVELRHKRGAVVLKIGDVCG
ncbi:zinc-binding dehydrogenase [Roseovarius pacificus]|uniref:zinc-binding dehydrogenase n=1 Tax=Roseovarius pacificus TaxID=337701 RepID=UPI00403A74F7